MSKSAVERSIGRVVRGAVLAGCCLFLFAVVAAAAGDQKTPAAGGSSEPGMSPEMMQKMMAYMTPGAPHKDLEKAVGHWKTKIKMWMGPGDPTTSDGTAEFEMMLGGRYLHGHHTGSFNGMPFEGAEIDGYDNGKKEYFEIWLDNMGTGVMMLTGQAATDGKGISYHGTMFDPTTGTDSTIRQELRWTDDSHFVLKEYASMPGPGGKVSEMQVLEVTGEKI